ncbi:MAG: MarR family transcriptional regulator [Alphaproteobacteria bacterium]|nr:MarR family transcriptional regulator [Alphaproteobacteria bacterium]
MAARRGKIGLQHGTLDSLLGYHLRRAQVAAFADFARTMSSIDLTPGQFGVLVLIAANAGLSQSALGTALGLDRSTVVGVIDRLERRGLVVRAPAPNDRRSYALKLTDKGEGVRQEMAQRVRGHERRIARRLSGAERERLIELLKLVAG